MLIGFEMEMKQLKFKGIEIIMIKKRLTYNAQMLSY